MPRLPAPNLREELQIGEIENLFWNNGSRDVPYKIPADELISKTVWVKINWNSRVSGTLVLKGIWNYAKYKDSYYFLDIATPLDNNKNNFLYAIYRDEWAEFIRVSRTCGGTLVKTNLEVILWEHLQTTSPTISNLGKSEIISLLNAKDIFENKGVILVKEPTLETLTTWVVTRAAFNQLVKDLKKGKGYLVSRATEPHDQWSGSTSQPPNRRSTSFSVCLTFSMTEVPHWSADILKYLTGWLKANKGCLNVCLVNNEEAMGIKTWVNSFKEQNDISNLYCVEPCWGLGLLSTTVEENNYISELDLSGLTSIELISKTDTTTTVSTKNVLDFFPHKYPEGEYPPGENDDSTHGNHFKGMQMDRVLEVKTPAWSSSWAGLYWTTVPTWTADMSYINPLYVPQNHDGIFHTQDSPHYTDTVSGTRYTHLIINYSNPGDPIYTDEGGIFSPVYANYKGFAYKKGDIWMNNFHAGFSMSLAPTEKFKGIAIIRPEVDEGTRTLYHSSETTGQPNTDFVFNKIQLAFIEGYAPISKEELLGGTVVGRKGALSDADEYKAVYVADSQFGDIKQFSLGANTPSHLTWWTFSPFFLNIAPGEVKTYKYADLPDDAKKVMQEYIQHLSGAFTYGPWMWEKWTRKSVSEQFKKISFHTTKHRPWVWPLDEETGDPVYLRATSSASGYNIHLHTKDKLTWYALMLGGGRSSTNYTVPLTAAWSKLPRKKPLIRSGTYVTWGATDKKNLWYEHNWTYDILGTTANNKTKYLSDHVNDYANHTPGNNVDGLDRIIASMYGRFSPELTPEWNDTEKGYTIVWPLEKDFQDTCQLFDLVGTNYIMCLQKKVNTVSPKISLIVKNNDVIETIDGAELFITEHPTQESIIKAINQHNTIFLYGHTFDIKTKFTFHQADEKSKYVPWTLTLGSFDLSTEGSIEYFYYKFIGPLEHIEQQFSVNKLSKGSSVNNLDLSRLLLETEHYTDQRKLDLNTVTNNNRVSRTAINTAYEDYTLGKDAANRNWAAGIATSIIGIGGKAIEGALGGAAATKALGGPVGAGVGAAVGAVSGVANAISGIVSSSNALNLQSYQQGRNLASQEAQAGKQIELAKNQADHTHKYAEIRMRKELDRISNHRIDANITERTVLEGYLTKTGKKAYHVIHNTPSPGIMPYLEAFFAEYGADVLVTDFKFNSQIHMEEGTTMIMQFSSVYGGDIKDVILLRNLQGRLVNGVKILS